VEAPFAALAAQEPDWPALVALLRELEFNSLVRTLGERGATVTVPVAEPPDTGSPSAAPLAPPSRVRVVESESEVARIAADARAAGVLAVSTVCVGGEPVRARLVGLALATGPGAAWYLPFAHRAPGEMFADETVRNLPAPGDAALAPLADLLKDPGVAKVGHDLKAELLVLRRAGYALDGLAFDVMLASFLLEPGKRSYGLDTVAYEHLGESLRTCRDLAGSGRNVRPLDELPVREAADCAGAAALAVLRLRERLAPLLEEHRLAPLFRDVELPLVGVLADMEWEGVGVDRERFARLAVEFRRELTALEQRIYAAAGTDFNLLSTPQLRHVLFEKLQLPVLKKTKTGASTDAEVLEELAAMGHELPRLLLEYREIAKLLSTYLEALPQAVDPATGRIHTSFNQIGAATGRLSSNNPNLQNIPVRTARGEDIRRGFVPRPGWRFVVADYSQIELRLLAHLSNDEAFVAAFRAGGDIHRQTAAVIFGVDAAAVTADQRARAKTINFATLYGQGPHALSRQLGISREDAKEFIDAYFARFAGVRRFLDEVVSRAREKGYAETIFGRRRAIPELQDKNFNIRSFGERTATNSPIQGSAADLIKVAMVRISEALRSGHRARLLLQVHDELVLEAPVEECEAVAALVKRQMEEAAALSVPLVADVGIGTDWVDAKAG
jgi:DNA polymerase-1